MRLGASMRQNNNNNGVENKNKNNVENKVNKDDANDTKKKQPEKTDNDEKPKEAPLNWRNSRVLESVLDLLEIFDLDKLLTLSGCTSLSNTEGYDSERADTTTDLVSKVEFNVQELAESIGKFKKPVEIVPPKKKNGGNDRNDGNDGNDGNGGGGRDEKKREEDEGNGGGKMEYPAGQSRFGQFSYGKVYRHGYGYQNGALKTGEKMLLLCCEFFGLLVNHLAKDIYSNVASRDGNGLGMTIPSPSSPLSPNPSPFPSGNYPPYPPRIPEIFFFT
ncbi:hypothetical protein GBA52_008993 [Prunus armeniaca]|nr:hypothetical protein GBA52_008993 [Prunus armeniaca]